MELSLSLLQLLLPQFFTTSHTQPWSITTATTTVAPRELVLPAVNRNTVKKKRSVSETEKEMVAQANAADVELYSYALELLQDKARQCGVAIQDPMG